MAEYLSPGVYVEEFDSGVVPVEGVSTSIAGFIGVAEKGPVGGVPRMATNFSDFKQIYGGLLYKSDAADEEEGVGHGAVCILRKHIKM